MKRLVTGLDPGDLEVLTSDNMFQRYSFNARERNTLFVNGQGRRFVEGGYALGVDVDLEGRGVAVADLDDDGRLDLVVNSVARQRLSYFHNEVDTGGVLRVELVGTRSNRDAIGALVRITTGPLTQTRVRNAGNGFQSQSEGTLHFGLGTANSVESLVVRWPSGKEERWGPFPADHVVKIVEGGQPQLTPIRRTSLTSTSAAR